MQSTLLAASVYPCGEAPMRFVSAVRRAHFRLERTPPPAPPLSRQGGQRRQMLAWHHDHGQNVSLTARHFGVSRPTVYRWLQRLDARRLSSLENRSCRPHRRRRPTWTLAQIEAVHALRETYPRWGKDKLHVLLAAELGLSVSRVGRILGHLKRSGQLVEPRGRISARKRLVPRPHAIRKPKGYGVQHPGDLVQIDTVDVRPVPGGILKHFTAHDVVSRWNVVDLHQRATAKTATAALEAVLARMPFGVKAIQVDNGSESRAEFEAACQAKGLRLFCLPPRSPKLNGGVERANRTHTEEFYECTLAEPTVAGLGTELRAWETLYNTVRPHQALNYQTPAQALSLGKTQLTERSQV